jgi:hypothetical protein
VTAADRQPSAEERARCELRADEIRASLHMCPTPVEDERDLVIVIDGREEPWVIGPENTARALRLLGGPPLVQAVAEWEVPPGHVALVIVIGDWIQVSRLGLTPMAKGGAA